MQLPDPRNLYDIKPKIGEDGRVVSYPRILRYHYVPQVFIAVMNGYLGDQIASLPLLNWLKKEVKIDIRAVVQKNLSFLYTETGIFTETELHDLNKPLEINDIPDLITEDRKLKEPHVLYQFAPDDAEVVRSHIIDYMCFRWFGCYVPENWREQPRIKIQNITDNLYHLFKNNDIDVNNPSEDLQNIVLMAVSSRTDSKRWNPEVFYNLVRWLNNLGYRIIFIGNDDKSIKEKDREYIVDPMHNSSLIFEYLSDEIMKEIFKNGMNIDFTSKLQLRETIYLMQKSMCLISMEGGVNHIAMLTDIPAIIGYSLVNPESRLFYRNGIKGWRTYPVFRDNGCKFCLTDFFITDWAFDQCYTYFFGENGQNRRYECCNIPLEKWQNAFERMLEEKKGGK